MNVNIVETTSFSKFSEIAAQRYYEYLPLTRPVVRIALKLPIASRFIRTIARAAFQPNAHYVQQTLDSFDVPADAISRIIRNYSQSHMGTAFEATLLYLYERVEYDELRKAIELYTNWSSTNFCKLTDFQTVVFSEALHFGLRRLQGRAVPELPHFDFTHVRRQSFRQRAVLAIFSTYCDLLLFDKARSIWHENAGRGPNFTFTLLNATRREPARVETNLGSRRKLQDELRSCLIDCLNNMTIPDDINRLLKSAIDNDSVHAITIGSDVVACNSQYESALSHVSKENIVFVRQLFTHSISLMLKGGCANIAKSLIEQFPDVLTDEQTLALDRRIHHASLTDEALHRMGAVPGEVDRRDKPKIAKAAWRRNDFEVAARYFEAMRPYTTSIYNRFQYYTSIQRLHFLGDTSRILNETPQPDHPNGYVMLGSLNCYNTLAKVAPALFILKRSGYAVGSISPGILDQPAPEHASALVRKLFNCLHDQSNQGKLLSDWYVDWDRRVIMAHGVNFYQGIYERLCNKYRRGTIPVEQEPFYTDLWLFIRNCDKILQVCRQLEEAAETLTVPIVVVSGNTHVAPYSVFRDYIKAKNLRNLRFVAVGIAYENYYTNLSAKYASSMAVADMTLYSQLRAPFLASKQHFEEWYENRADLSVIETKYGQLLSVDRVRRGFAGSHHTSTTRVLQEARDDGRRVVACFGKILCDLAVPYDGGPAHADMIDWVKHSIEVARANPDILLLVKPHPHERRPEISKDLTERLVDVLPSSLPDNVIVLDNDEFNAKELARFLDLAVLWNGTAALELSGLGLPVLMCSYFGQLDYPIDLSQPLSRQDYETWLTTKPVPSVSMEFRRRAMALLYYMGTDEVAIPNTYSLRPATNDAMVAPIWRMDKVREFLRKGDPYMTLAAQRIVEGVSGKQALTSKRSDEEF